MGVKEFREGLTSIGSPTRRVQYDGGGILQVVVIVGVFVLRIGVQIRAVAAVLACGVAYNG